MFCNCSSYEMLSLLEMVQYAEDDRKPKMHRTWRDLLGNNRQFNWTDEELITKRKKHTELKF